MTVLTGLSKLYVGGYDLSGDVGAIGRIGGGPALLDVSSLDLVGMQRITGRHDGAIDYSVWFDKLVSHAYLSTLPQTDVPLMVALPGTAAGDELAMLVAKQLDYPMSVASDLATAFSIQNQAAAGYPVEWGKIITAGKRTDTSATASGTGIDLGIPIGVTAVTITGASAAATTVVTTATAHGLATGESVVIAGSDKSALNVEWTVTVTAPTTFTVPLDLTSGAATGGTVTRTSRRGWSAQCQVFSIAGTSVTVTLQDSHEAVSGSFANVTGGAFAAVSAGNVGAERIGSASGILKRYARVKTTGTFSSAVFATGVYGKEG